jgi:copper oxidase (laccase) domain-containing protein
MIIQGELLKSQPIIHGVSTKKYGNMYYDRDQKGEAEENLQGFLARLHLKLEEISLFKLPVNNTSNVALVQLAKKKGRIVLHEKSPEVKEIFKIGGKHGFDACISKSPNTFLGILPADCAPVMLFDPHTEYYALIHAGAVGVQDLIVAKTIFCLKKWCRVIPQNLLCYVGPNICSKHYKIEGQSYDIASAIKGQLLLTQVKESQIEIDSHCTYEDEHLFFSHFRAPQKDKDKEGRQIAIIGRK